jgi:hypothetical protein
MRTDDDGAVREALRDLLQEDRRTGLFALAAPRPSTAVSSPISNNRV